MKRSVLRCAFSLVCSILLLIPCVIGAMAAEEYIPLVLEQTEGFEYASEAELDAVWAQTGNTEINDFALDDQTVNSGSKSILLNDTENNKSLQAYGSLYQSNKAGTEFIMTAYYNVEQLQSATTPLIAIRSRSESSTAYTYSTGKWDRLSVIRMATTKSETLRIMLSSSAATVAKVYFDDVTVSVLTEALALDYIEEKLAIAGTPDLPVVLTSQALSLQNVESAFMDEYVAAMADARNAAGRALTKAEVQVCIDEVNATNQSLVEQMAAEVATSQTLSTLGDIALPTVSDSSVTLAWTGVTGDTNNRIQMLESGPALVSQPAYGGTSEQVTMTLTVSKGPYSAQVNVTTTINPYSKNMSQLVEVADQLDFNSYLNGQDPNWVTSDLTSLPSYVSVGTLDYVTIKWRALDANSLGSTSVMTNAGKVTRGTYGTPDTTVILRATLSKLFSSENVSYSRDFYLTVPSMSAEDGRNMITENPGFEAVAPTDGVSAPAGWLKQTVYTWGAGKSDLAETNYAQIDKSTVFNGAQSLRITVDKNMVDRMAQDSNRTAGVQNEHIFTAREGHLYTLKVMVLAREVIDPSVSLVFLDNEGVALAKHTTTYTSASKSHGIWKSLTASACAPAGTVMVAVELDGGAAIGTSWFDDVCLRELPLVANGSFDLGTTGWTTSGTASNGVLTLNSGVAATSAALPANRGVAYYLTVEAQGSGTAALRFLDSSSATTLAEYAMNVSTGTNTFYAYAPANTGNVSVVLTGGTDGLTVEDVKINRAPSGTYVEDGDFTFSANAGKGTPWDLESATIGTATGRSGAGLTITGSGSARSAIIPIMDGKSYTFTADVKGTSGAMTIELYRTIAKASGSTDELAWSHKVTSTSSAWNTISYTFDQIPAVIDDLKSGLVVATIDQQPFAQGEISLRTLFESILSRQTPARKRIITELNIKNRYNISY